MENNVIEMEGEEKYPVELVVPQPENPSRWLALATIIPVKMILLIPHIIVMYVLGIVMFVLGVLAQIIVLFTGAYPEGLFKIVKGAMQWQARMNAYMFGLTDKYPPFSFE